MNNIATLQINRSTRLTGTVKWFDMGKGFGFVVVPGIETDFLLHKNVLLKTGVASIADGSVIEFDFVPTANGFKITEVFYAQPADEVEGEVSDKAPDHIFDARMPARVKWFDPKKGYGFVHTFGSTEDVFVGVGVLRKAMLGGLETGEAVSVQVAETDGRKSVYRIFDWC